MPYMEERGLVIKGKVGNADCIVMKARDIYEVTAGLLRENVEFFGDQ